MRYQSLSLAAAGDRPKEGGACPSTCPILRSSTSRSTSSGGATSTRSPTSTTPPNPWRGSLAQGGKDLQAPDLGLRETALPGAWGLEPEAQATPFGSGCAWVGNPLWFRLCLGWGGDLRATSPGRSA